MRAVQLSNDWLFPIADSMAARFICCAGSIGGVARLMATMTGVGTRHLETIDFNVTRLTTFSFVLAIVSDTNLCSFQSVGSVCTCIH